MIACQFIFQPGVYDDEFTALDDSIDAFAKALPGFVGVDKWRAQKWRPNAQLHLLLCRYGCRS